MRVTLAGRTALPVLLAVASLAVAMPGGARADNVTKQPNPDAAAAAPGPAPGTVAQKQPNQVPQGPNGDGGSQQIETVTGNEPEIPEMLPWSFTGIFGHYDLAQLQRGYQVYKEVCSNCHSMKMVAFRNLQDLGYSAGQVKALAESYQVDDGPNDQGEMFKRPGRPSDYFPSPFPNEQAAAAAYGKAPPDMSLLAKARGWERGFPWFILDFFTQAEEAEGPDYIHAVLNGYTKPDNPKYNIYLPNHKIAMPKPLSDGQVAYTDGAPQTVDQYSKDVAAFLMWAAEPKLEQRKEMGFRTLVFLIVFATLLYFVKRRIWAKVGGDVVVGAHPPRTTAAHPAE